AAGLVAGTDPATLSPGCVCKLPRPAGIDPADSRYSGNPGIIYADPAPSLSSLMTGQPTGAYLPAACRYRQLHAPGAAQPGALDVAAASGGKFDRVVAVSQAAEAHFSEEPMPVIIPDGITLSPWEVEAVLGGSINPKHFVIDLTGRGRASDLGG